MITWDVDACCCNRWQTRSHFLPIFNSQLTTIKYVQSINVHHRRFRCFSFGWRGGYPSPNITPPRHPFPCRGHLWEIFVFGASFSAFPLPPSALGKEHPPHTPNHSAPSAPRLCRLRHSQLGTKVASTLHGPTYIRVTGRSITPRVLSAFGASLLALFSPSASAIICHLHFACYSCINGITTSSDKSILLSSLYKQHNYQCR